MKKSDKKLPSNKTFGLFFAFLTATAAVYVIYFSISTIAVGILMSMSIVLFTLGMLNSEILSGPNYLWMRIGELIGLVVSPLILAIIFGGLFVQYALFGRAIGRDSLALKATAFSLNPKCFWVERVDPHTNFKNQY